MHYTKMTAKCKVRFSIMSTEKHWI